MACPKCGSTDHIAVAHEKGSLWVECLRCGNVWIMEKEEEGGSASDTGA